MNPFDSINDSHANIGYQTEMDSIDVSRIEPYDITDDRHRAQVISMQVIRFDKRKGVVFFSVLICSLFVLMCLTAICMIL